MFAIHAAALATSVTNAGTVVTLLRSRGTLLLSEGPFEFAQAVPFILAAVIGSCVLPIVRAAFPAMNDEPGAGDANDDDAGEPKEFVHPE